MTTSASQESKSSRWWLLVVAAFVVGGLVAAAVAMTSDEEGPASPRTPSSGSVGDPDIRQAKWKFTVQRGPGKKFSKKQKAYFVKQRRRLREMAREVFDALFLSPEKQRAALRANFTAKARKSYLRAGAGLPERADDVRVRRRSARIVIENNARATMDVRVVARGKAGPRTFATEHRSVLYSARSKNGWKVLGFTVDQKPFKRNKAAKSDEKNTGRDNSKKSKKKRSDNKNRKGDRS